MVFFNNMKTKVNLDQVNNKKCVDLLDKAGQHFEKREFEKALEMFTEIIKNNPQDERINGVAIYYSGIIFISFEEFNLAKKALVLLIQMGGIHKQKAMELLHIIQNNKAHDKSNDEWVFINSNGFIVDYYYHPNKL